MDNPNRLKFTFKQWVEFVRLSEPHLLNQMVNQEAEFRDDEKHPELQAADLLAYRQRKYIYEVTHKNSRWFAENLIWKTLQSPKVEALNLRYEAKQ
jgi:hypothetical protein